MTVEHIQHDVERLLYSEFSSHTVTADGAGTLEKPYEGLRNHYSRKRESSGGGLPAIFDRREIRLAYIFAYHPTYCHLAAKAYQDLLRKDLRLSESLHVLSLGTGPAAEVVGLDWALRNTDNPVERIRFELVDREPSWTQFRDAVLPSTLTAWTPDRATWKDHQADFARPDDLRQLDIDFGSINLVVMHNMLNELDVPERKALLGLLADLLPPGCLCVIVENPSSALRFLPEVSGFQRLARLTERSAPRQSHIPGVAELLGTPGRSSQFKHEVFLLKVEKRLPEEEWFESTDFDDEDADEDGLEEFELDPDDMEMGGGYFDYYYDPDFDGGETDANDW